MKIALFLGAGASVPFNKPTTSQMKERLLAKYDHSSLHNSLLVTLLSVDKFPDMEYVLSTIDYLSDHSKSLGHEFLLDMIRKNGNHQMTSFRGSGYTYEQIINELGKVRKTIQNEVFTNYSWQHDYDKDLGKIYDSIFTVIKKYSKDELRVFTTNYDRAIEEYCGNPNRKTRCIDGFNIDVSRSRFSWMKGDYGYMGNNSDGIDLFLYKLHGSLDWKKHKIYGIVRTGEESISDDDNYEYNMLVYPTLSPKDGFEKEPYKSIRENFDVFMKTVDVCIVIGYSFRDDHVNTIFKELLNKQKRLIIISPSATLNFLENLNKEKIEADEDEIDKEIRKIMKKYLNVHTIDDSLGVDTVDKISDELDKNIIVHGFS